MSEMSLQKLHEYIDLLDSPDRNLRQEARTKVSAWEKDVSQDQVWVAKDDDGMICNVLSLKNGKVSVIIVVDPNQPGKKTFFGFDSFIKNWRRLV